VHPLAVAQTLKLGGLAVNAQIGGLLHDTVEDSRWTLSGLESEGFDYEEVIVPVGLVTHMPGESYEEYGSDIVASYQASQIKAADIANNMLSQPKPQKIPKYKKLRHDIYVAHGITFSEEIAREGLYLARREYRDIIERSAA
jgi:(p)ppGpp synthase/HD superfamily hydrolase